MEILWIWFFSSCISYSFTSFLWYSVRSLFLPLESRPCLSAIMEYDCWPYESAQHRVFNGETGQEYYRVRKCNAWHFTLRLQKKKKKINISYCFLCFQNSMINQENLIKIGRAGGSISNQEGWNVSSTATTTSSPILRSNSAHVWVVKRPTGNLWDRAYGL